METDKDHIHLLVEYDTTDRVCDIVKAIKQETTYYLWQKYNNSLSKQYWNKKIFWSDGYFACNIGEVSSNTIQKYIESQGQEVGCSSHYLKEVGFRNIYEQFNFSLVKYEVPEYISQGQPKKTAVLFLCLQTDRNSNFKA